MPNYTGNLPFFDATHLPAPENAYVAWLDVMGVRAIMSRSLPITANFVFKLHVATLEARGDNIHLYPVMDGVYVVSSQKSSLCSFLKSVFSRIADVFVSTPEMQHRFVIRAAIAYGPVAHGRGLGDDASHTLHKNPTYRDSLLLGMPMIQALESEPKAPPFGIYTHETARAFAPAGEEPFHFTWWHWFTPEWAELARDLADELDAYFKWCAERSQAIEYESGRIEAHRRMSREYLIDITT